MPCPDWEECVRRHGFDAYGVCDFAAVSERLLPCRAAARLPAGARRVLALLFPYRCPDDDPGRTPRMTWRAHAHLLYANWLNYFVYQSTPYDLAELEKQAQAWKK